MSHDIESNYTEDYHNEDRHCRYCSSFLSKGDKIYCRELDQEIKPDSHCDFFQSAE